MATLAEEIKARLQAQQPEAPEAVDPNATASKLYTKQTGKAAPTSTSRITSAAATSAASTAKSQLEQGRLSGMVAGEQLGAASAGVTDKLNQAKADLASQASIKQMQQNAAAQSADLQRAAIEDESTAKLTAQEQSNIASISSKFNNAMASLASQRGVEVDDIFSKFEQSNKDLAFRRDASELEQLAHTLRMSDTQYVDQLTRVAKLRGLEDELAFGKEAMRLSFGENLKLLQDVLDFAELESIDENEFMRRMGDIDINMATSIAASAAKAENVKNVAEGAGTVIESGLKYAATPGQDVKITKTTEGVDVSDRDIDLSSRTS